MTATRSGGEPTLGATLARISALGVYLDVEIGRGPELDTRGWITPAEVCAEDGRVIAEVLEMQGLHSATDDRRVQASFAFGGYAWYALGPIVGAFLLAQRVPPLDHDNVSLWVDPTMQRAGRLSLSTPRFVALPWDPEAGAAHVEVVPDLDALRDRLHDEIVAHMTPIIAAMRRATPLTAKQMWLEVADRVGSAMHEVGEHAGMEADAIREAEALIHRPASPMHSPRAEFREFEHDGSRRVVALRGACCLSYRLPTSGYCVTCPLLKEPERTQRIRDWMAEELAQLVVSH